MQTFFAYTNSFNCFDWDCFVCNVFSFTKNLRSQSSGSTNRCLVCGLDVPLFSKNETFRVLSIGGASMYGSFGVDSLVSHLVGPFDFRPMHV